MRQEFLVLAEAAEVANGKIFIHGGCVERHQAPGFPTMLTADIATSVLVGWSETNRQHVLELKIVNEDEQPIAEIKADFTPGRPSGAKLGQELRHLFALKGPFPIQVPGQYKVEALLDGELQEPPFRFWVEEVTPQQQR
jgi:Family of unknown function (DUF6941)